MIVFISVAAAMVLLVLGLLLPALLGRRRLQHADRNQQNVLIARERIAELEGLALAGTISSAELERARMEIERALLDDLSEGGDTAASTAGPGAWAGLGVAVVVPLIAGLIYAALGEPAAIGLDRAAVQQATQAPGHPTTGGEGESLDVAVERLAERLQAEPDNAEDWYLLAGSYMTLQDYAKAANAFGKVRELVGDHPDVLVRYADALAMSRSGLLDGEPERLVLQALDANPHHTTALWLAGMAAFRRDDARTALAYWRRAEPNLAENPTALTELRGLMARAEGLLGEGPATASTPAPAASTTAPAAGPSSVAVEVSLAAALAGEAAPEDTVFVLAQAVSGPPMPLAVVRKQVKDLPLSVILDDSMAMMPNMTLSTFPSVRITARVSKTGTAKATSGDLYGEVRSVSLPAEGPVLVEIGQRVP